MGLQCNFTQLKQNFKDDINFWHCKWWWRHSFNILFSSNIKTGQDGEKAQCLYQKILFKTFLRISQRRKQARTSQGVLLLIIHSKSDSVCGFRLFSLQNSAKKVRKSRRQKCVNHKNHKNLVSMWHFCWEYSVLMFFIDNLFQGLDINRENDRQ